MMSEKKVKNGHSYETNGWKYVSIHGEPRERGHAYGLLCADEFKEIKRTLEFNVLQSFGGCGCSSSMLGGGGQSGGCGHESCPIQGGGAFAGGALARGRKRRRKGGGVLDYGPYIAGSVTSALQGTNPPVSPSPLVGHFPSTARGI